tara:strand:+ start:1521 stop:1928 length:408 start_codon:yes stop_codon:yes gene_type:complete
MKSIYVTDIKIASILIAFGVPRRESDPTTCEIRKGNDGRDRKQYSFWFDVDEDERSEIAERTITDFAAAKDWETINRDIEDPLYWMKGVMENRDSLIHEMHNNVEAMRVIEVGEKTVVIGHRASQGLKDKMKSLL